MLTAFSLLKSFVFSQAKVSLWIFLTLVFVMHCHGRISIAQFDQSFYYLYIRDVHDISIGSMRYLGVNEVVEINKSHLPQL